MPNVPAIAEALPGFSVNAWVGLAAPARTPHDIVERLNDAVNKAVSEQAMQDKLKVLGMMPALGTPSTFSETFCLEQQIWTSVMKRANIAAE